MKKKNLAIVSSLLLTTMILSSCGEKKSTDRSLEQVPTPPSINWEDVTNELPKATEEEVAMLKDEKSQNPLENKKEYKESQEKQKEINELRAKLSENPEYKKLQKEIQAIFSSADLTLENRKKAWWLQMKIRKLEWEQIKNLEKEIRLLNEKLYNPQLANHPKFEELIEKQYRMWELFIWLTTNEEFLKLDMEINELFKEWFDQEKQKEAEEIQAKMKALWSDEMKTLDEEIQAISKEIYTSANPVKWNSIPWNDWWSMPTPPTLEAPSE